MSNRSFLARPKSPDPQRKSGNIHNSASAQYLQRSNKKYLSPFQTYGFQTNQQEKGYDERLLKQDTSQLDVYDPFQTPPNFLKAQRHQKATSIGLPILSNKNIKDIQVCPCCQNPINKQPIPLCCKEQQLLFLGIGYPLYYKLTKYIAYIILLVFVISGSALYFLVTLNCNDMCLTFFGFRIINFQPQQERETSLEYMNMVTAIGIFVFVLYLKSKLNEEITFLQTKVVCPSQYTIMLQNLPLNYTQYELQDWIKNTLQCEPALINIGYNIIELQSAYEKRNSLTIQLQKLYIKKNNLLMSSKKYSSQNKINSQNGIPQQYVGIQFQEQYSKQKQLIAQMQKCDKLIHMYRNNQIQCRKNGTAFVTFEKVDTVERILEEYQKSRMGYFFTSAINLMLRNNKLTFKQKIVLISRAPAPRQVIWQNLEYSHFRSLAFQLFFIGSMFVIIYIAFKYQFKFSAYAYQLRTEGAQSHSALIIFQAIVISLIVVLLNSLLRIIILIFTKLKGYHSYTAQQKSFCFYYTLMYVFNSCFMIYIVHGQYPSETNQLLLIDIHLIMLANAFSQPLFKLFDPIMWYKIIYKRYIKSLTPEKNPYTQMYVNKWFEGHQISNGDNYQYITRILIVSIWFAHPAPLGVVFCLIGLFVDYWIGKILLLRVYKRPQNISKNMGSFIINCFQLMPLVYICGVLQFTYKSTSSDASIIQFLTNFFQYSITFSVLVLSILGYLLFFKTKTIVIPQKSYSEIKNYFGFNYQTQNPITKFKGEINYLNCIVKDLKLSKWATDASNSFNPYDKEFVKMLIQLGAKSSSLDLQKKRAQISKVKIKMLNSIQLQQNEEIELDDLSDKQKNKQNRSMYNIKNFNADNIDQNQFKYSTSSEQSQARKESENKKSLTEKKKFRLKKTNSIFV